MPFIVYHPQGEEIYEHPEKPQPKPETPTPPPQVEKTTEKVKREKVEKKTEAITWEEFDRRNDEKYTRSNPLMWSDSELKARNKERQPYAMIDDNKGKILVKDIYEYRGPLKRAGFEFDGYGWWYKPLKDRPSDNRKIVSALQKMNIPTRVTEGTAIRSLYSSDRAKEIYDTHGAEKGQEIIDKAAQKTLHKYGLI
jgi:hypothetical protein